MRTGRPANFDFCNFRSAESKVQALVVGRNVTAGGGGESRLSIDLHARAEPVAVAARSTQRNREPVAGACVIHEHQGFSAERSNDDIHPAIVVQVAERGAAPGNSGSDARIGALEASIVIERQQRTALCNAACDRSARRCRARGSARRRDPSSRRCRNLPGPRPILSLRRTAGPSRLADCDS